MIHMKCMTRQMLLWDSNHFKLLCAIPDQFYLEKFTKGKKKNSIRIYSSFNMKTTIGNLLAIWSYACYSNLNCEFTEKDNLTTRKNSQWTIPVKYQDKCSSNKFKTTQMHTQFSKKGYGKEYTRLYRDEPTMQFHLTHLIHIKRHSQFVEARNYSLRSSRCINFACLMGLQHLQSLMIASDFNITSNRKIN